MMELSQLQHSYYQQLLKAGVAEDRAFQAARSLSREQLQIISEIWSDWSKVADIQGAA